ncbi:MAG: ABC transporter substrate binding protein [Candidatus Omnitrophota bacterium]
MKKKSCIVIAGLIIAVFFWASKSYAQDPAKVVVIKSLEGNPCDLVIEGIKNYLIAVSLEAQIQQYSLAGISPEQQDEIFAEINYKKPSIVISVGTAATKYARQSISGIPVVFTMVLNPERSNISPPGSSLDISFELKLNKLKQVLPEVKTLGVIYSSESEQLYTDLFAACRKSGIDLIGAQIESNQEFPQALKKILPAIDCFIMISDSKIYFPKAVEHLLLDCLRMKVPVMGLSSQYTKAGALLSLDCDYHDLGMQTAEIVYKIINEGKKVKDLEIVNPRRVNLSLNLLIAKRLNIKINEKIAEEADRIFGR